MLTGPLFRDPLTNRMIPLFSCKVTIPGVPDHVFQPTKFTPSPEDARNFAADYALTTLFGNALYDGAAYSHGYYAGSAAYGMPPVPQIY